MPNKFLGLTLSSVWPRYLSFIMHTFLPLFVHPTCSTVFALDRFCIPLPNVLEVCCQWSEEIDCRNNCWLSLGMIKLDFRTLFGHLLMGSNSDLELLITYWKCIGSDCRNNCWLWFGMIKLDSPISKHWSWCEVLGVPKGNHHLMLGGVTDSLCKKLLDGQFWCWGVVKRKTTDWKRHNGREDRFLDFCWHNSGV